MGRHTETLELQPCEASLLHAARDESIRRVSVGPTYGGSQPRCRGFPYGRPFEEKGLGMELRGGYSTET